MTSDFDSADDPMTGFSLIDLKIVRDRLVQKARTLEFMSITAEGDRASELRDKSRGVQLARSFVDDAIRELVRGEA